VELEERRALWSSLGVIEDWLGGGIRSAHEEPDFEGPTAAPRATERAPRATSAARVVGTGSIVNAAVAAVPTGDSLEAIAAEVLACSRCRLADTRKKAVPGQGVDAPLVMVIGEGPGAEEDAQGRPFVGPAGKLLDKMLASVGLDRDRNCFIANVVKCRPPGNRDPEPDERAACGAYLRRQIALLRPKAILCVGRVAAQALLGTTETIGRLRGRWMRFENLPLLATYHPSALLRDESLKRPAWEDLKLLREFLASASGSATVGAAEPGAAGGDRSVDA
jgi:DNA polymerase